MTNIIVKQIESDNDLRAVLNFCYSILDNVNPELYGYEAWHERFHNGTQPLLYAIETTTQKVVSAVLGRAENQDSMVLGLVACHPDYRRRGITKKLITCFEELSKEAGYKYITAGSKEDGFYKSCGYNIIFQIHGQNIFQKIL